MRLVVALHAMRSLLTPRQGYYARALDYVRPILELQDVTTIQALLALVQYHFRAPVSRPNDW